MATETAIHTWGNYGFAAAPPLTAVFVAALLAFSYTLYFNVRTSRNEVLKDYNGDLVEIQDLCRKYWLGDHQAERDADKNELMMVGHELRCKIEAFTSLRGSYPLTLGKKHLPAFDKLERKLWMTATGGTFQTAQVEALPEKFGEICENISEMRTILRVERSRKWIW